MNALAFFFSRDDRAFPLEGAAPGASPPVGKEETAEVEDRVEERTALLWRDPRPGLEGLTWPPPEGAEMASHCSRDMPGDLPAAGGHEEVKEEKGAGSETGGRPEMEGTTPMSTRWARVQAATTSGESPPGGPCGPLLTCSP